MGRPKAYETGAVVEAARDLFWERGYELASVGELEGRTGLNRSSIYQAFGSKRGLFQAALRCYVEQEIEEMLSGMRRSGAGLGAVREFFTGLARSFRADPARTARGCLLVNSIVELGPRDPDVAQAATAHLRRLRETFAAALSEAAANGEVAAEQVRVRADLLASTTMGVFLGARIDSVDAAELCDAAAAEVSSWRLA